MAFGDSLKTFIKKQFIDVIQWTEEGDDILACRYPMQDMEIQNGGQLTVRESQMAMFVNEGRCADVFGPGLYTINTHTLPVLTNLKNWDKLFQSPFKSDVYYFSSRQRTSQRWGTTQPITIRDKDFGAVRLRAFGIYSWHIADVRAFHTKLSGTRETYKVADIEAQLRETIVGRHVERLRRQRRPVPGHGRESGRRRRRASGRPDPGLCRLRHRCWITFVVENLSLPEELQKRLDDTHRHEHARQHAAVHPIPGGPGAAHRGGQRRRRLCRSRSRTWRRSGAGRRNDECAQPAGGPAAAASASSGLRTGPATPAPEPPPPVAPVAPVAPAVPVGGAAPAADMKFCFNCGSKIPRVAKFCAECGTQQPAL